MDSNEEQLVREFQGRWSKKMPRASLAEVEYCSVDLGTGGFGAVNLVRYAGRIHAMKAITKAKMNSVRKAMVVRETRLLHALKHPFTARLTFHTETPEYVYLGMEPATTDLGGLLERKGPLCEADCRVYGAQVTMALGYLHLVGWIHRDLKPGNVLVMADGYVKLTDFGLAWDTAGPGDSGRCGSPGYMAPEAASDGLHTTAMDVWSLGVTLFVLLTGRLPYTRQPTWEEPQKIKYPEKFSADLVHMMQGIFKEDEEDERLSCKSVLQEKWFDSIDMDKLYKKELAPPYIL